MVNRVADSAAYICASGLIDNRYGEQEF